MLDGIVPQQTDRYGYATMYLEWGWKIFVLGAGKTPLPNCDACRDAGPQHDPEACLCLTCHGFYAATSDRDRLELMMTLHPAGHLAVRTGQVSNIVVLDAEGTSDGDSPSGVAVLDSWESWVNGWALPGTLTASTPSGGVHLYYRYASSRSRNRVLPGLDVKSDGGYVAVPQGDDDRNWLAGYAEPAEPSPDLADWLATARGRSSGGSAGPQGFNSGYDYRAFAADGCPGGHRDEFFNDMCFRLRRLGASKPDAEHELRKHWSRAAQPPNARWFMPWEHVAYKLERVWRTVEQDPPLPPPPVWRGGEEPLTEAGAELIVEVAERPIAELPSDRGNAERFIRMYGDDVRFLTETRTWLMWDGNRWVPDRVERVPHLGTTVADDIRSTTEMLQDPDERRIFARHALASESLRSVNALITMASRDPRIAITADAVDRDPMLLVVQNGVLDLRTGELRSGRREDLCTRQAAVAYDPEAEAKRWEDHVRFVTKNNAILAAYLRRAVGYTLTGHVSEQSFFMLEGSGSNGKNAFIEPILDMLGDYAQTGTSALITGGDEQHPTILADLIGARLVFIDEARQGRALNVERVKQLTGSKKIKARRMGRDFFEFDAQLKLWIAGNNHPTMKDPSDGIWRRLHRVIFRAKVPESRKVGDYGKILYSEEAPGILRWALRGLQDYVQINGLGRPDEVEQATQEVRSEEDIVAQFLEEVCERTGSESDLITVAALYVEFSLWCVMAGVRTLDKPTRVQFGRDLSNKGLERVQKRIDGTVTRGFTGLRIARSSTSESNV